MVLVMAVMQTLLVLQTLVAVEVVVIDEVHRLVQLVALEWL